jgi:hypothetical protein
MKKNKGKINKKKTKQKNLPFKKKVKLVLERYVSTIFLIVYFYYVFARLVGTAPHASEEIF